MNILTSRPNSLISEAIYSSITPNDDYTATATWSNVTNWSLSLPALGSYRVEASSSVQLTDTDANGTAEVYLRLARNGVAISGTMRRLSHSVTSGSFIVPFAIPITSVFNKNDSITLQVYKPNAGDTVTVGGNTGVLGVVPNFYYNNLTSYVPVSEIPVTPWETTTITIKGLTANPTKGTGVQEVAAYRRNGSVLEIIYNYIQANAGTAGTGEYVFLLPIPVIIDNTKIRTDGLYYTGVCGSCVAQNAIIGRGIGNVYAYSYAGGEGVMMHVRNASGDMLVNSGGYGLDQAACSYSFNASIPILGW